MVAVVAGASVRRVFCFFVLLFIPSTANSPNSFPRQDGNTHPAQRSTAGPSRPGPDAPSPEQTKGDAGDRALEGAPRRGSPRSTPTTNASTGLESLRPKRPSAVGRVGLHRRPPHQDTENIVSNLKNQLKESQAAQVHTRSIINILQEKIEAQESDLSIMKDEISQLRREQTTQRDLIAQLQSSASDSSWAIASVKRTQDQTIGDVAALKRVQERHNETMFVVEEVMMTSALEVRNQEKRWHSVQEDLHRVTVQANEDRGKVQRLHRAVDRLTKGRAENENENRIDENDSSLTNHLSVYNPQASGARIDPIHGKNSLTATGSTTEGGAKGGADGLPPSIFTKLAAHDAALELTKGLLGNLSDHVTSVETQLSLMSERLMLDSQLLQFQQSFVNFTSQVYQLQKWRKTQTEQGRYTDDYQSQHENDMASVIFHLESQSERLHALEQLVNDEHRTKDRTSIESLNATVVRLKHSVARILSGPDQSSKSAAEREKQVQARLKATEEGLKRTDGKLKDVELTLLNASLFHCRAVNEQLGDDVRGGNYVRQMADVQMKISEQTTTFARIDRGLAGIFQELDKNAATASALSQQLEELKKLSPDVATLQRELLNFVLQLPTDCYDVPASTGNALRDGVYLIRPETGRHSARTFCLVDPSDSQSVWTVIQRRRDGRESFARSWADYRSGFGDAAGEFWLGNENVHRLTTTHADHRYRLRVDLWDVLGRYWTADYGSFRVHSEAALYRLELGEFTGGNATDALRYSNLMPFSAVDRDNDVSTTHCAQFYQSGWWYKHCHYSNLNGRYTSGVVWFHQGLNDWIQLRQTTMRISMVTG